MNSTVKSFIALFKDDPLLKTAQTECGRGVWTTMDPEGRVGRFNGSTSEENWGYYEKVLHRGFWVEWKATNCTECVNSGGCCGFDEEEDYRFWCYCSDWPHARKCGSEMNRGLIIGLGFLKDGREVAVKRLYKNNYKRVEQFMNEVEILTRLRRKDLVSFYGCTSKKSCALLLVYKYISNGTVADHLHGDRASTSPLSWSIRMNIAIETASALAYLHASEIIHRDVKTNKILIDSSFSIKVADFGVSRLFPSDITHVSTVPQGTPGYVDPEYYQSYQLSDRSDVYSFGVVLVELISSLQAVDMSRSMYDINLSNLAITKIQNRALQELIDPNLGQESDPTISTMICSVAELAFRCLQQDKEMRSSINKVLEVLKQIQSSCTATEKPIDIHIDRIKSIRPSLRLLLKQITLVF